MKKQMALLLVCCMLCGLFSACGKGRTEYPETMEETLTEISEIKSADVKTDITYRVDGAGVDVSLEWAENGSKLELSKLSVLLTMDDTELYNFSMKDVLRIVDDTLYLNLKELAAVVLDYGEDYLDEELVEAADNAALGWLPVPLPDEYEENAGTVREKTEELLKNLIPVVISGGSISGGASEKPDFTLAVTDNAALADFFDGIGDCLDKNTDKLAELLSAVLSVDGAAYTEKLVDYYREDIISAMEELELDTAEAENLFEELLGNDYADEYLDFAAEELEDSSLFELPDLFYDSAVLLRSEDCTEPVSLTLSARVSGYYYYLDLELTDGENAEGGSLKINQEILSHSAIISKPSDSTLQDLRELLKILYEVEPYEDVEVLTDNGGVWDTDTETDDSWDYGTETVDSWDYGTETNDGWDDTGIETDDGWDYGIEEAE